MSKKVLYISGGIVLFLLVLTIKSSYHPTPVVQDNQQQQEVVAVKEETPTDGQKVIATDKKSPSVQEKASTPTSSSEYTYYSVTEVVDGDTIKVNISGTVTILRLIGLDTPETLDPRKPVQCFGKEASNKAKELLSGKKVRIEKDSTQGELDKYGRTLAYVYREDGLFYNKYMIEQGYAHEYTYNTPYKYQADFKAAEKSARENQKGLWSPNTCNGDTTQAATGSSASTPAPSPSPTSTPAPITQTSGKFYTSSYGTAKYYYPEACDGWKTLSASYLKVFNSLQELLNSYPSRTKSPDCQ